MFKTIVKLFPNKQITFGREGLLSKFKHEKIDKSVIVVNRKDEAQVKKILKKFGLNLMIMRLPEKRR